MLENVQTQKNKNHGNLKRTKQETVRGATKVRKSGQTLRSVLQPNLMGMSVKLVEGDEMNIKVTTPMDLKIAEMLLEEQE